MKTRFFASLAAGCALVAPLPLLAQSYQGQGAEADSGSAGEVGEDTAPAGRRLSVQPYIEASQIFTAQLSPFDDVLTYTQLAAGVDAAYLGRNNGASVSLRYERNFGYGDASDSDTISGIARGYTTIVPQVLTVEAGALASRTTVTSGGSNFLPGQNNLDNSAQTYSAYVGPTLATRIDRVDVTGNYRLGYTRVDSPDFVTAGGNAADVFDESVSHSAQLRAGTQPGEYLPVGIGVGGGYFREDVNNLDQRVVDSYLRGDVTVPITPTLAVVAGVGYEDVEVSSRDALRDAAGNPVVGPDGRLVTDETGPRRIAFEADGLIWDVGVLWRPSQRTALSAVYGRRYDSDTYYGNFSWQPSRNSSVGVNVYDTITGFGGRLNNSLA
ncbi:MAG: preprotein translocase subunit YajC, partial [Alphaproteobacteria bacterium]|nr:preprotein translocase subunit YajC [Alphaproteobacteria bacterium]